MKKERLQRIERIYELHEKWRDIQRVLEEENGMKSGNTSGNNRRDTESDNEVTEEEEDKLEKNGKRKRTEESMYEWIREKRKKRRREKFDEELINEGIDEETKVACLNLLKILRLVLARFYYRFIIVLAEFQQFQHL